MTVKDTCRLCLTTNSVLQDSHLMPKATYKNVSRADSSAKPQIIKIGKEGAAYTDKQISDYFLCHECELKFCRHEEKVLEHIFQEGRKIFLLRDEILALKPDAVFKEKKVYLPKSLPSIPCDSFLYFALSVFWRASAKIWDGIAPDYFQKLKPYEEVIRQYLLSENQSLLDGIFVAVFIPEEMDIPLSYFSLPGSVDSELFRLHHFFLPGVEFNAYTGDFPLKERLFFCIRPFSESKGFEAIIKAVQSSELRGRLKKEDEH